MSSVGAQCGREGCRAVGLIAVVTFELSTPTLGNNWAVSMDIEFTLLNTKCLFICVFMCVSKYVHGGPGAHKDAASLLEDGSSWLFPRLYQCLSLNLIICQCEK